MDGSRLKNRSYNDYTPPGYRPIKTTKPVEQIQKSDDAELFSNISRPKVKRKRSKKLLLIFSTLILIIILVPSSAYGYYWYKHHNQVGGARSPFEFVKGTPNPPGDFVPGVGNVGAQTTTTTSKSLRLVATGDMIPHSAILQAANSGGKYNFDPMLSNMKQYFTKSDVRFCNQATPAGGPAFGITGYPVFNAPLEWPRALENVGCNLINLGTNHTNDKGQPLIDATAAAWDNRPNILASAGANRSADEQTKVHYFTVKNIKFAFLTYTTYTNNKSVSPYGINTYSDGLVTAQMQEARTKADFVIVSMRWGTEYSADINPEQDKDAQQLSDLGADVIIGSGPHFLEPVKKLKSKDGRDTLAWFSIGNFLNAQLETESLIGGFATMDINLSSKKITSIGFMPVYMHYEWTPAQAKAQDLLARHNFSMYPLDEAAAQMANSQINTTVDTQHARVNDLLNKYTAVPILTGKAFLDSSPD